MNILIVNQPINNRGDEAAHKSLMRNLNEQFPSAQLTVLFQSTNQNSVEQMKVDNPNNTYVNTNTLVRHSGLIRKWALRLGLLKLSVLHPINWIARKYIKQSDLVVCAPGGICMGLFQNWRHIYLLALAVAYQKKVAYYSRSFGPFPIDNKWNRVFKKRSYWLLRHFDFISIRDLKTMQLADKIGISYVPSIDTAFLDTPYDNLPGEIESLIKGKEYIVFVPNSLTWHAAFKNCSENYIVEFYTSIMKMLLSKCDYIVMLPQLFNKGDCGDEKYFKRLRDIISDERVIVVSEQYSSDIQQTIISDAKLMIGARYHSVVFAINNEVPFVALSYEHKISGLLNILQLEDYIFDLEQLGINQPDINFTVKTIEKIIDVAQISHETKLKAREIARECMQNFVKRYQK
jgi:colanic acid/amylovoran biosynthesis protein